jgi:hypothetical protein
MAIVEQLSENTGYGLDAQLLNNVTNLLVQPYIVKVTGMLRLFHGTHTQSLRHNRFKVASVVIK